MDSLLSGSQADSRMCGRASTSPRCEPRPLLSLRKPHASCKAHFKQSCFTAGSNRPVRCAAVNPRQNSAAAALAVPVRPDSVFKFPVLETPESDQQFDILGLGQAMVDYSATIDEATLSQFNVAKGDRRVVTVEERGQVMQTLDEAGCPSQVSPGGSLANTLVAVARLARSAHRPLRVCLGGCLGTDTLGQYFNSQLRASGVQVLLDQSEGHTGTVMVLTTPDAQRSFLSFFTSGHLQLSQQAQAAVRAARMVVIEGYMWEMPGAEDYILDVVQQAKAGGGQVVLTAGDPGVVARHREAILRVLAAGVDLFFSNAAEAAQLRGTDVASVSGMEAAGHLGALCPLAVVTDGSKGSYVVAAGQVQVIPPHWAHSGPVDTCGAGDAYAAGVLYALLSGADSRGAGEFGARVASAVIGRYGAQLCPEDAMELATLLPAPAAAIW